MARKIGDSELDEYAKRIGRDNFRKEYHMIYQRTMHRKKKRHSGKDYENDESKLNAIKEKYKHGVSLKDINEMLQLNL